jgi:hypothetical protein
MKAARNGEAKWSFQRFPVVSLGAEYLVMGHLLRRNVLAYKAPPNNEGYDLICIHPDPRAKSSQVRVQVKSRLATDCNKTFPLKGRAIDAFDFLVVVFLNIGFFFGKSRAGAAATAGRCEPEFYTFPPSFIREHHSAGSSWEKVSIRGLDVEEYKNEAGLELIARKLAVPYPTRRPREVKPS